MGQCPLASPPLDGRASYGEEVCVYKNLIGSGFLIPQGERLSGSEHRKVLPLHSSMSFFFVAVGCFVFFFGGGWSGRGLFFLRVRMMPGSPL